MYDGASRPITDRCRCAACGGLPFGTCPALRRRIANAHRLPHSGTSATVSRCAEYYAYPLRAETTEGTNTDHPWSNERTSSLHGYRLTHSECASSGARPTETGIFTNGRPVELQPPMLVEDQCRLIHAETSSAGSERKVWRRRSLSPSVASHQKRRS
jgi:hypothetical protein